VQVARVDIGGRRLRATVAGAGSPPVVFEAGLGNGGDHWALVAPAVAGVTTAVTYDRAGYGGSDPSSDRRSSAEVARDLHALLSRLELPAPYVLVGHSLGALHVRLFAADHPDDVAGLVLVDGSSEHESEGLPPRAARLDRLQGTTLRINRALARSGIARLGTFRKAFERQVPNYPAPVVDALFADTTKPQHWAAAQAEHAAYAQSVAQAVAARDRLPFPRAELTVISAVGMDDRQLKLLGMSAQEYCDHKVRHQTEDLVALSPRARHAIAERSGHVVQHDEPGLIVRVIEEMVAQVRSTRRA
jgi:pimeloyl-ACP methyl ester carboxylesterase